MKGELVDILLGILIKVADEIADVPYLSKQYISYLPFLFMFITFLVTLRGANDFYFNIITLSWFFFSYFGKSIDNDNDKQYWNILFFITIFTTFYSFSYPLPQTSWSILLLYIIITSGNVLENFYSPEESSLRKVIGSLIAILIFTALYNISYFIDVKSEWDLRFVYKQSLIMLSYMVARLISKVYIYIFIGPDKPLAGPDKLPLEVVADKLPDLVLTK